MIYLYKYLSAVGVTASLVAAPGTSTAFAQQPDQAEEIVVTARRSGIPVWRVTSGTATVVLVGAIPGVTTTTKWDPEELIEALRKADRVMFPVSADVDVSPFAMVGYFFKWRRQEMLPRGQTLADILTPEQYAQLVALQQKGILNRGFEHVHPLHLALKLQGIVQQSIRYGPGVPAFVSKAVVEYKLKLVPLTKMSAKPLAADLFDSPPSRHVACLMASVAMAEAGPAGIEARSQAWAARRVPEVMASAADHRFANCWPAGAVGLMTNADLLSGVEYLLADREVTVAIVPLQMLADKQGVLDELAAAGFDIEGPTWKSAQTELTR